MKIYNQINDIKKISSSFYVSIGNFDGFHIGHIDLINKLKEISIHDKCETVVITFVNLIKNTDREVDNLTLLQEKLQYLKELGIDNVFIINFSNDFKKLSKEDFLEILLNNIHFKGLVVGEDFHFGNGRDGDRQYLKIKSKEIGFNYYPITVRKKNNKKISSSIIRRAIKKGNLEVNKYLYKPFNIRGMVIKGKQLGNKIGFPTINIVNLNKIHPAEGVYFTLSYISKTIYKSMTFVGPKNIIETHVFDFNKIVYGNEVCVYFIDYYRENQKINNINELQNILENDKNNIKKKYQNYQIDSNLLIEEY